MQKKRLSTSLTFFLKFVFPALWIGGFGTGAITGILEKGMPGLPFLIIGLIFTVVVYYSFINAKNVDMDDKFLYINNFRKTIQVPYSEIKDVSEDLFFSPRLIVVKFKHETEFGKKIVFFGYTEFFLFFSSHPAVDKIRTRIKLQHW